MEHIREKGSNDPRFYFNRLGRDFEEFMDDFDVERRSSLIFDILLRDAPLRGARVLEVGCGTGRFSKRIAALGGSLTVLDIGDSLVAEVAQRTGAEGCVGDACALPFESGSFDFVISSECIEHTLSPDTAIREMCRVCRPEGVVCLTTPNILWYPVLWAAQALRMRKFEGPERWMSPFRAVSILRDARMRDIRLGGCHLWPFQIRFLRPLSRYCDRLGSFLYPFMINFGVRAQRGASGEVEHEN